MKSVYLSVSAAALLVTGSLNVAATCDVRAAAKNISSCYRAGKTCKKDDKLLVHSLKGCSLSDLGAIDDLLKTSGESKLAHELLAKYGKQSSAAASHKTPGAAKKAADDLKKAVKNLEKAVRKDSHSLDSTQTQVLHDQTADMKDDVHLVEEAASSASASAHSSKSASRRPSMSTEEAASSASAHGSKPASRRPSVSTDEAVAAAAAAADTAKVVADTLPTDAVREAADAVQQAAEAFTEATAADSPSTEEGGAEVLHSATDTPEQSLDPAAGASKKQKKKKKKKNSGQDTGA